MLLERTPQSGNLIPSDIKKCAQSVSIKRDKAIENLRLEALRPQRIIYLKEVGPSRPKPPRVSSRPQTTKKGSARNKLHTKENITHFACTLSTGQNSVGGIQDPKVKWLNQPLLPDPPDGTKKAEVQGIKGLHCAVEERNMAAKYNNSQSTSTFERPMQNPAILASDSGGTQVRRLNDETLRKKSGLCSEHTDL